MKQKTVRFGIIGCGLMGREFGCAAARWCHLTGIDVRPEITAVCDADAALLPWFRDNFPSVKFAHTDYRALLERTDVEAVYCAVPHHLHREIYLDILRAGKHLMGEKPFGIHAEDNREILEEAARHPELVVKCSSEMPFYPGAQEVFKAAQGKALGTILEVNAGFLHCSDMDPDKPVNWKRQSGTNGEYGCLGDLGMHVFHLPLRLGWQPRRLTAALVKAFKERPDGKGGRALCDTWDNALLCCEVESEGSSFPMVCKTYRVAPGETNSWYIEILGTRTSAAFSTKFPKTLRTLNYRPGEKQEWRSLDLGSQSVFPTLSGSIFEFGFSDAILQMWASFLSEFSETRKSPFPCASLDETRRTHRIFTAALTSQREKKTVEIADETL